MKKVFNVHFTTATDSKTQVSYYVAESIAEVLDAIPVEALYRVVGITIGPVVEVL